MYCFSLGDVPMSNSCEKAGATPGLHWSAVRKQWGHSLEVIVIVLQGDDEEASLGGRCAIMSLAGSCKRSRQLLP